MAEKTKHFSIVGMTCDHCVRAVTSAIEGIEGVRGVKVSLPEKKAVVTYDDSKVKDDTIKSAVEGEGYMAKPQP
jgi:copper chaperone